MTVFLLLMVLFLISTYNLFVKLTNQVKTNYSDIDIQLKRRASLVQSLVDLVKDYAKHENDTFKGVASARSAIDNSKNVQELATADNLLTQTLRSLFMVTESNPDLKANENYKEIKQDLVSAENLVASYREEYNSSVEKYNNSIQTFPNLISAFIFNFKEAELFNSAAAKEA